MKLSQSLLLRGEMEQKGVQLDRETFFCSFCQRLPEDPVTIPCGHSYCTSCIESFWDGEDQRRTHSCPQCGQTFTERPVLVRSSMLAALVEQLKTAGPQESASDHLYAGSEDVACDVCTGRKRKALKTCLTCPASYCENHLRPHYVAAPLKQHRLVDPTENAEENVCTLHDEVMKMFCLTDQQSICYLCSVEEHKGHDAVSAAAERALRQEKLEVSRLQIQQRIQDIETDVEVLRREAEAIARSANEAAEESEKIFTERIRLLEQRSSDLQQRIRSQQETEMSRVKELQEKLQQEIGELRRKDAELERLSQTEDHYRFLHSYPSLSEIREPTDSFSIKNRPLRYFEDVTTAVSELLDVPGDRWANVTLAVNEVDVLLPQPEPETRDGFLQYSRELTLDPNTAYEHLFLFKGNRKAERISQRQHYHDHPDRFVYSQVLSAESLTGRCYWEVEWRGRGVYVAVAYKDISRGGVPNECRFGHNDKSWALYCDATSYRFWFNNVSTPVSGPPSSTVGVYLDHRAGVLSFYSVSESMTLLHRVRTTFRQPLYAGLYANSHNDIFEFCN